MLATEKHFSCYFYDDKVVVTIEKKCKRIPTFLCYSSLSDRCRSTNSWQKIPYEPNPKSKVYVNGDLLKLKDALGVVIHHVWGFEDSGMKHPRSEATLYWAPPQSDLELVEALLDVPGTEHYFIFEAQLLETVACLAPTGVAFHIKGLPVPDESQEEGSVIVIRRGAISE